MKKYIALAAIAALAVGSAYAQITQTSTAIDPLVNDINLREQTIEQVNASVVDIAALSSALEATEVTLVTDTNANVVLSGKAPTGGFATFLYTPNMTNSPAKTLHINFGTTVTNWLTIAN